MAYRRNTSWANSYSSVTKVLIHWNNKSAAYSIKFTDTKHWNEMQIAISYIKNFPYGERDYDAENKVWFLIEKHIPALRAILDGLPQFFQIDFVEKPIGQTNTHTFVPIDIYFDKFKTLTGQDIKGIEYDAAKRLYRKACRENHPDLHRDGVIDYGKIMSEINECWSQLELLFYKNKKEPEYVS